MERAGRAELLAPAGSQEGFYGALHAGADAVYLGGSRFGARAYAENFTQEELVDCIRYGRLFGVKIYLTVNTLLKEWELKELPDYLLPFYQAGLNGVIVQDPGVLRLVREQFPGLKIHASTQMTLCSSYGARLLKEMGVCRIVPARELGLEELSAMKREADIELETFVHGAMCYCYSGQCLFSSILGGRSGNRGRCAQPCRLPYAVGKESQRGQNGQKSQESHKRHTNSNSRPVYPLSLKDMCTIGHLPALIEAGIDSFKIEGRMKKPEYAAGVTAIYRKYIDLYYELRDRLGPEAAAKAYRVEEKDWHILSSLYIRSETQEGYYFQKNGPQMVTLKSPAYNATEETLLSKIRREHLEERPKLSVTAEAVFLTGQPAVVTLRRGDILGRAVGEIVERAKKQPITEDNIRKQLGKLGDSPFQADQMQIQVGEDAFYPLKQINELRRLAARELEQELLPSEENSGSRSNWASYKIEEQPNQPTVNAEKLRNQLEVEAEKQPNRPVVKTEKQQNQPVVITEKQQSQLVVKTEKWQIQSAIKTENQHNQPTIIPEKRPDQSATTAEKRLDRSIDETRKRPIQSTVNGEIFETVENSAFSDDVSYKKSCGTTPSNDLRSQESRWSVSVRTLTQLESLSSIWREISGESNKRVLSGESRELSGESRNKKGRVHLCRVYVDGDLLVEQSERILDVCRHFSTEGEIKSDESKSEEIKLFLSLPYIIRKSDEQYLERLLALAREGPFCGFLVRSLDGLGFLREALRADRLKAYGLCSDAGTKAHEPYVDADRKAIDGTKTYTLRTDAGLYVWNSQAAEELSGLSDGFCIPYELNASEQRALLGGIAQSGLDFPMGNFPMEKIVYSRIPMMITANCVAKTTEGCRKGSDTAFSLTDRYQKKFPVLRNCLHCTNIIYNGLPFALPSEAGQWQGRGELRLDFTLERGEETSQVLRAFWQGDKLPEGRYTTGHEKRGVE